MKNFKILGAIALLGIFFFIACEKEEKFEFNKTTTNYKTSKQSNYTLKSNAPQLEVDENGVLVFDDLEEFQAFFDWAETETENYINSYLANYPGLNGDELADSLVAAGFDSELPLKIFEESFTDYNSLRKKIEIEMQPYLELEDFDITETPEAHFINNQYIRTILNEDGAYKIGDTTYFPLEGGLVAMGPQADYNQMVDDISNNVPIDQLTGPYTRTVIVILTGGGGGPTCSGCRTNRLKMVEKRSGNKKYYLSVGVAYLGPATAITASVKSYARAVLVWKSWPYSKNVSFNTVNVFSGSSCNTFGSMQGKSKSNKIVCIASTTDIGGAARRVKCNTLSATGKASDLSISTVTIGW